MKNKLVLLVLLVLFLSCLIASIMPSIFNIYTANEMTTEEQAKYNDTMELEPKSTSEIQTNIIGVEKLNWFTVVNSIFEKFSTAKVIDVNTRKTYNVERVGGYNHADVETLTAKDTEIFKSLYGGTWSWTRRPVWVQINGAWIAGSINGMPHSYSYISNNNEDGHTCIHFYMSRTHGTDNLDPAHQEAVQIAYDRQSELTQILRTE